MLCCEVKIRKKSEGNRGRLRIVYKEKLHIKRDRNKAMNKILDERIGFSNNKNGIGTYRIK